VRTRFAAPNPGLRLTEQNQFVVRFRAPGKHTVECWYLDKGGKVVGYGKTEVTVAPGPATRPAVEGRRSR
jgi:hypothetical protein